MEVQKGRCEKAGRLNESRSERTNELITKLILILNLTKEASRALLMMDISSSSPPPPPPPPSASLDSQAAVFTRFSLLFVETGRLKVAKHERDSLLLLKVDDALSSGGLLFKGG